MDLLFSYTQEKKDKKSNAKSICNLKLYKEDQIIFFESEFNLDFHRYGSKKNITFYHTFELNIKNGDIDVTYRIINDNLTSDKMFRNCFFKKKNDFKLLFDLTENGFERGEKRLNYWGVKYTRAKEKIRNILFKILENKFKNKFALDRISINDKVFVNSLFDLLVEYHLDVKEIKSHDNVFYDIQHDYPKKKWLEKNQNKFLPALLDSYGIKSKYLISELNKYNPVPIYISSLNYICKLFGENYVEYLRKINWTNVCCELPPNKKTHILKNEFEKNCIVSLFSNWEKSTLRADSLIYSLNKLLSLRDLVEQRGVSLKYKAKNDFEFDNTVETWTSIKLHFARGFKVRYCFPNEFIEEIEKEIVVDNNVFKIRLLIDEDDFRVEGFNMKNCMAKQFPTGVIYLYLSMQLNRKKINLQYKKNGQLVQSLGKANTQIDEVFSPAIDVLTNKIKNFPDLDWKREKFDFLMS
jgi:hypothetical protein